MSISATIFGRLTGDPEQKQPQNGGNPYVTFSIASNTGKKDNNNNNMAQFVNISVFGKQGDTIMQYFHKGSRIAAHVRDLEVRAWIRQDNGQAQANFNAVLTGFDFVDTAAESGNGQPAAAPARGYAPAPAAPQPNEYAPAPNYGAPPVPAPQNYGQPAAPAQAPVYGGQRAAAPGYGAPAAPGSTPWGA